MCLTSISQSKPLHFIRLKTHLKCDPFIMNCEQMHCTGRCLLMTGKRASNASDYVVYDVQLPCVATNIAMSMIMSGKKTSYCLKENVWQSRFLALGPTRTPI